MSLLDEVRKAQVKPADRIPKFNVGDTVRVHFRIVEGEKERIQVFEGVCIARKGGESPDARFTVRRVAFGEGVERVFPLHSPRVERVEVVREGHTRRAKLYYLRERMGKAARVKARGVVQGKMSAMEMAASGEVVPAEAAPQEAEAAGEAAPGDEVAAAESEEK